MFNYQSIKELREITSVDEVNTLLSDGWKIIYIMPDYDGYVLARYK